MTLSPFVIEFQPYGIRLHCSEPVTILDAARQTGIQLRADCGGEGRCGKCAVQVEHQVTLSVLSEVEKDLLDTHQVQAGFRLACRTLVSGDTKIMLPAAAALGDQVLQTEGSGLQVKPQSAISQLRVEASPAALDDLASDFSRIRSLVSDPLLSANLHVLREIPEMLRQNDWKLNLLVRDHEVIDITPDRLVPLLGLAVDVGSTKLSCYLVDLESGQTLAANGISNPQIGYGEDIMSRLGYALNGPEEAGRLHSLLIQAINTAAREMCEPAGLDPSSIADVCLVGNTAMHHFFLNLPVRSLAAAPFVPALNDLIDPLASDVGITSLPGARVYVPPVIAGFVGSDHLAFLFAAGFGRNEKTRIGIDIGTNTEIALQRGKRIISVSTASGPAFEGAHIRFGMRAAPGTIEHVRITSRGEAEIQVIGNKQPAGICGSGILDAVAELRNGGLLNERGRLDRSSPAVFTGEDGKPAFLLAQAANGCPAITLSQQDIDQVLLAKGAIRAGIDVLMDQLGVRPEDIDEIVIAGAFGTFMLPRQAMRIGMLPQVPLERVHAVGNAAGDGARMMLASTEARHQAESLARQIEYLELTLYPDFPLFFARGIQA